MTKQEIFNLLTPYQIFSIYLGEFEVNKHMYSPFQDEDTESFIITDKFGDLVWKDFGGRKSEYPKDCIGFVQALFGITFKEALGKIYHDRLGASNISIVKAKKRNKSKPYYETGDWEEYELDFWRGKKILLSQLRQVYPCRGMGYDNRILFSSTPDSPAFIYQYSDSWRTYRPLEDKKLKFRNFGTENTLEGYDTLPPYGDKLIVTSSYKDVMTLRTGGYNSICPVGEGNLNVLYSKKEELSTRFDEVYVLFDRDSTGRENTEILCSQAGWKPLWMEYEKDPNDLVCKWNYMPLHCIIERGQVKKRKRTRIKTSKHRTNLIYG